MRLSIPTPLKRFKRLLLIGAVLGIYILVIFVGVYKFILFKEQKTSRLEVRDGFLYRDGRKLLIKGIGWDPSRPKELPWNKRRSMDMIEHDFARIREAGFNTIRTWELLSTDELAAAERHNLLVLMGIWVDRDGPFRDPLFRAEQLEKVAEAVRQARTSPNVLGYLVMNEPRVDHVLKEGIDTTLGFLHEIAGVIKQENTSALIGFSNWPGVEFLDEPSFGFVAANLYPFRPSVMVDTFGYEGMVRMWKERIAGHRPFIVSEFGISVAPSTPPPDGPGGATEVEQARRLPELADAIIRTGAAGGAVFMWLDCWWKNNDEPNDELTHDPNDGEEWFGLITFDNLSGRSERVRPALDTVANFNRAVMTLPTNGIIASREVEIEIFSEEKAALSIEVSINDNPYLIIPCIKEGPWIRGRMGLLAHYSGPQSLHFILKDDQGKKIAEWDRIVVLKDEAPVVTLEISGKGRQRRATAHVSDIDNNPITGIEVKFCITEAHRRIDKASIRDTNQKGIAYIEFDLPPSPSSTLVVAGIKNGNVPLLSYDIKIIIEE